MAEASVESRYLAAGANRYSAAADWGEDGFVAFGSDTNVCIWSPTVNFMKSSSFSTHFESQGSY
jgi:elongator complex protein 2